jgi:hypothetical protein
MKININAVTPNTVNIHGQTVTREYAERVLLPLLVASQGQNHAGIIQVVQAFAEADLSLEGAPHASRIYQGHLYQQKQEKARLAAEAAANAERCREPSAQEIAEYHAAKKREIERVLAIGRGIRASRA